jgi:hypothetical protein
VPDVRRFGVDGRMGFPGQYRKIPAANSPAAIADDPLIERELLQSENARLRKENTTLRSTLRAAGRLITPYLDEDVARRR